MIISDDIIMVLIQVVSCNNMTCNMYAQVSTHIHTDRQTEDTDTQIDYHVNTANSQ